MFPQFAKIDARFDTSIGDMFKQLHAMYQSTPQTSDMPDSISKAASARTARDTRSGKPLPGLDLHETHLRIRTWTASPSPIILRAHSSTPERTLQPHVVHTAIHVLDSILWPVDFAASYPT
jgi:hypothetical protein